MIDLEKEREAFEIACELNLSCVVYMPKMNAYRPTHIQPNSPHKLINLDWQLWQKCAQTKQAEIDALKNKVAELKSKNTNYIVLSCSDLQAACDYGAPDKTDEQLETEMVIEFSENGHSGSGYYAYYADLPDEGSILLRNCGVKVEVLDEH